MAIHSPDDPARPASPAPGRGTLIFSYHFHYFRVRYMSEDQPEAEAQQEEKPRKRRGRPKTSQPTIDEAHQGADVTPETPWKQETTMEAVERTLGDPDASKNQLAEGKKAKLKSKQKDEQTGQKNLEGGFIPPVENSREVKINISFETEKMKVKYNTETIVALQEGPREEAEQKIAQKAKIKKDQKVKDVEWGKHVSELIDAVLAYKDAVEE